MQKLLLHTCCAPCLTSVHEKLEADFAISSFWYNPCIEPLAEYNLRLNTLKSFCETKNLDLIEPASKYAIENRDFSAMSERLSLEPEGGQRCAKCIYSRLFATAIFASKHGFPIFSTTLTVSPHKNAALINEIGRGIAFEIGLEFLAADFKKQGGYQRSVELSKEYRLYRQSYCGCRYSNAGQRAID